MGIKKEVDEAKKKILISHANIEKKDKLLKQFCRKHQLRHTINNTNCPTFHLKAGYIKVEARKYSLDSINFIAL
jgi:hypothetical protein